MDRLGDIGGEPLKGSGFENEKPVTNDDGVTFVNAEPVIAGARKPETTQRDQ